MDNSRSTRHKKIKKKRRGLRRFLTVLILLVIAAGAYVYFQYKQGMSEALDGAGKEKAASYDFNGKLPNNGQINVLLLGSDSRGEKHSRTDSILIAHYNQNTHEPKLVSIMRDSYVDVPGHGKQKINAAFAFGGPELLRKTIEENFGININYYSIVDFKGFPKIVDTIAPDGIKVNVPHDMSSGIDMTLHKGEQTLHGKQLLGYVRFRHDNMSDFGRVQRQQEVLGKLKDKATEINNVVKLPKILGMTAPYIDTNIDTKTMLILGKDVITGQAKNVDKLRIPLDGTFENERIPGIGAVLAVDLEKNKAALQQFLSSSK